MLVIMTCCDNLMGSDIGRFNYFDTNRDFIVIITGVF
jgi:hypothetical protein